MATDYIMSVDLDGQLVVVTDGHISGATPDQHRLIQAATMTSEPVQLVAPFGDFVEANLDEDNPVGALAALAAASMRWRLIETPPEVEAFLDSQTVMDEHSPHTDDMNLDLGANYAPHKNRTDEQH